MRQEDHDQLPPSERTTRGDWLPGTALGWLILASVVVYVLQHLLKQFLMNDYPFEPLGGFSVAEFWENGKWWTVITHQFVHAGFGHLFFNVLFLWMAGRVLQDFLSKGQMILLYLGSGLFGLGLHFIAQELPILLRGSGTGHGDPSYLVGASGAAVGMVAAAAVTRPFHDLLEPFRSILPLRLGARNLAIGLVIVTGAFILVDWIRGLGDRGELMNVAHHVHLGGIAFGALMGWILVRNENQRHLSASLEVRKRREELTKRAPLEVPSRVSESDAFPSSTDSIEQEESTEEYLKKKIDPILDKINEHGYGSLTEEEKEILGKARDVL